MPSHLQAIVTRFASSRTPYLHVRTARRTPFGWVLILVVGLLTLASCASNTIDETSGSPAVCDVHQVKLRRETVPIVYGLIIPSAAYRAAEPRDFPHANRESWGGCCVDDELTHALVMYCPECRKAEAAFLATHPSDR
jgi:hypothetical protein